MEENKEETSSDCSNYKDIIIEKDEQGQERINRINYEISALQMGISDYENDTLASSHLPTFAKG